MSDQDQTKLYQQIIAKCWGDAKFKASLIADPRAVLAAEGFIVPDDKSIKIVECLEDEMVFQIPFQKNELSVEELDRIQGCSTSLRLRTATEHDNIGGPV